MSEEKAPCEKCRSEIPREATRCPNCGYAPQSEGKISDGLLLLIFTPVLGFSGLIAIITPMLVLGSTMPLESALLMFVLFGTVAAVSAAILYGLYKKKTRLPASTA